ncbi:hypothetical protein COB47_0077 [Caldicellulosiruptor obsidiansis OB47]|uniref:Cellobiose phosphorylase n=1 Tax=Caldicellulosiruptor obsidiansis (strain ATCC BAA-2073 / JCM 16842 / OB47) TaxID=608506 RepID=D9TGW7_CALOO|nr:hypothetical protein [Caldicellulosiruptor obsidiansis]ADL41453.1 hypothetical protein COB47_0077 [Caldicellulosiruptor obsidiansis OB47]
MQANPKYYYDEKTNSFCIENYQISKPFSSFLPGIAGIFGIPLWCFYVNRGQCIVSFGTKNKDGAILEFLPADRAYRLASTHGFRTFLKLNKNLFYEPFQIENLLYFAKSKMSIFADHLEICEENSNLGIKAEVRYYTLANKNVASLVRELKIVNVSEKPIDIEALDGLALIVPYGKGDFALKNMSRTAEAWNFVENLDKKAPYFRFHSSSEDTTEVVEIKEGNFFVSFDNTHGNFERCDVVIDPKIVFGISSEIVKPYEFIFSDNLDISNQVFANKTCCAFAYAKRTLKPHEALSIYSIIGHAKRVDELNHFVDSIDSAEFFDRAFEENKAVINAIIEKNTIVTSDKKLDEYAKICYLDNILRGGMPFTIEYDNKKDVIYLFSRKHGDLERDYNFFEIQDTYYSQGNGNFRDINQNRRNDIIFNPDIFDFNVWYFMSLIQLDSYNPLVVKGVKYRLNNLEHLEKYIINGKEKLKKFFEKDFLPYELIKFLESQDIKINISKEDFVNCCLVNSEKVIEADPGEGYWIDHFTYNFDLIENFESIYPDKMRQLLLQRKYYYYDNEHYVKPRKERIKIIEGQIKQHGAYALDKEKQELINSRADKKRYVRTHNGHGDIYTGSLIEKLLVILLNRMASLDPFGVGVEMEASKPGWNDALNGLPGIFGSSVCETFELLRLVRMLKKYFEVYLEDVKEIEVFEELYNFFVKLKKLLSQTQDEKDTLFYWIESNNIKEEYREKTRFGVSGNIVCISREEMLEFLDLCSEKFSKAKEKAFDSEKGLFYTYFINQPVEYEYDAQKQEIKIKKFSQKRVAFFLESQVRAMKVIDDKEQKRKIYQNVKESSLFDRELKMYKTNESLANETNQLGRIKAFTPGWLENESIFMHMEYKYLLELLKGGLYTEFFEDFKVVLPPYMDPAVYGRSIFENSSFIASSSNPDKSVHGTGFVARLSGTTTEFLNMELIILFGEKPFEYKNGELIFKLSPKLPGWMFTEEEREVEIVLNGNKQTIVIGKNQLAAVLFGRTLVVYHNPRRLCTYDPGVNVQKYILHFDGEVVEIEGEKVPEPYSYEIRNGMCKKIEVLL